MEDSSVHDPLTPPWTNFPGPDTSCKGNDDKEFGKFDATTFGGHQTGKFVGRIAIGGIIFV
jgi:hypothetical protein